MSRGDYHGRVCDFKRQLLISTMRACEGNRSVAAERLGLRRTSLIRLIRDLDIQGAIPAAMAGHRSSEIARRLREAAARQATSLRGDA